MYIYSAGSKNLFFHIYRIIYHSGGTVVSTEARNTEGIIYYQFQVRPITAEITKISDILYLSELIL